MDIEQLQLTSDSIKNPRNNVSVAYSSGVEDVKLDLDFASAREKNHNYNLNYQVNQSHKFLNANSTQQLEPFLEKANSGEVHNDQQIQHSNNGVWNKLASTKLAIKSRLKLSPHNNQNQSSKQDHFLENQSKNQNQVNINTNSFNSITPTHGRKSKSREKGVDEVTSTTPTIPTLDLWTNSNSTIYNGHGCANQNQVGRKESPKTPEITVTENECDNNCSKLSVTSPANTSWNKIFQCFSVFKFRKISTTDPKLKSELELHPPELKRIMTESDFYLYELASNSEILDYQCTKNLGNHLGPRAIGYSWDKIFSSTTDGFSLHSLYRKMEGIDSPVLFVIEDIEDRVFGAMLSCAFKISENFYGNSDTFLFRCNPNFEVFKWSGDNFYFIQGQVNSISVGSDDGRYGIWLDDNLYMGRTEQCSTFGSPPLVPEKDFKVKAVEAWTVSLV